MSLTTLLLVAACVSCSDRDPVAPTHATVPDSLSGDARAALGAAVLSRLECTARVDTAELVCRDPADTVQAGGVRPQSVLGLNQVELVSTNVQYDSLTQIFSFDVTLENLLGEPIGTPDGVSVEGSRVVYVTGPTATAYVPPHDTGTVAVDNPDGYMNLTAVDQPYHFFPGILQPSEVSDTVHWRIFLSRTVEAFEFAVQVATPTPSDPSLFPPPPPGYVVPDDSLHVIQNPVDTVWIYYRRYADIVFQDTASDEARGEVIWSRNGRIIGGSPWAKSYLVEFPDPGATWPEFKSFMDSLQAEPAVKYASPETRRGPPGEIHLRYPSDGTGHQRTDWIDRASSVAALHAIRAPLAWGCETGTYADARVRVGVLEWHYISNNPDLGPSTPTIISAHQSLIGPFLPPDSAELRVFHGNAMSGILSAAGDNGQGIAGMMWRTDLRQYELGGPLGKGTDADRFVKSLVPSIIEDQPRVLSISINFQSDTTWDKYQQLIAGLRRLLTESPKTVVVKSTGNQGDQGRTQPWAFEAGTLTGALSDLKRTGFEDRILFVSGTDAGNTIWANSDFILGETDIAAPANDIDVLGLQNAQYFPGLQGDVVTIDGTSASTALVAGVAAQLAAMDSTLTAAEVKDYILRGASAVKRIDPLTGDSVLPQPVSGAPESIYQLDAYGALVLMAAERPGTPICGFPISVSGNQVILERPAASEALTLPSAHGVWSPSVAQGGRLIAATGANPEPSDHLVYVIDHHGTPVQTVPYPVIERRFLERDTVDVLWDYGSDYLPVFVFHPARPGVSTPYNPLAMVEPAAESPRADIYEFDPTGNYLALQGRYWLPSESTDRERLDVIHAPSGTIHPIREWNWHVNDPDPECPAQCQDTAQLWAVAAQWRHGALHLTYVEPRADFNGNSEITDHRTAILDWTPSGQTETIIEDWFMMNPWLVPDDSVIHFREADLAWNCFSTRRATSDPTRWRHATAAASSECEPWLDVPFVPLSVSGPLEVASRYPGHDRSRSGNPPHARSSGRPDALDYVQRRPTRIRAN